MNAKQIGEQVASSILHHIDKMYPAMWSGVPKSARTSVRNFSAQQIEIAAADLLERMAWVPVSEELPPYLENVLIANRHSATVGCLDPRNGQFWESATDFRFHGVTHWRYIDPPSE